MKLYGLYEHDNIPNLEYNHRKFCDLNNIEYNNVKTKGYLQKFHLIYSILERNIGEVIFFIDSHSYFKSFNLDISISSNLTMQILDDKIYDNFFIIKSNKETLNIFKNILSMSTEYFYVDGKYSFNISLNYYIKHFGDDLSNLVKYPYYENNQYLSLDIKYHENYLSVNNILVCYTKYDETQNICVAEILCNYKEIEYEFKSEKFEIINPGCKNAFITLYTDNIKKQGIVSERNIEKYCISNDITYIVYRDIPDNISKMSGNWYKPYVLLEQMNNYEYVSWIDSDVIITDGYQIDFIKEIRVFNDPASWFFNSGFMMFKSVGKNKEMLKSIINKIEKLEKLDSVYSNGGDQLFFINEFKKYYPDILPESSICTNSYIDIFYPDNKMMIHFMGIPGNIRHIIMKYYDLKIGYK